MKTGLRLLLLGALALGACSFGTTEAPQVRRPTPRVALVPTPSALPTMVQSNPIDPTAAVPTEPAPSATSTVVAFTPTRPIAPATISGRVIGLNGKPVRGALVSTSYEATTSDASGSFRLPSAPSPQWVTARRVGFLSRTRAAAPGSPVLIRLTPDDGRTLSLHFVGDTMVARRFYNRNGDGNTSDGLLQPGDGIAEHLALFSRVQPLLSDADVTTANLESALTPNPYFDPNKPRPPRFHPTQGRVLTSDPALAAAMQRAGVDVVSLANNHVYDAVNPGVTDTLRALDRAGVAHFGAGLNEAQAWRPRVFAKKGQTIAFLGCTTIYGRSQEMRGTPTYVASDADRKGGSARCEPRRLAQAIRAARARHDAVVLMIHGGDEYVREPQPLVRDLTLVAQRAGATLVINHHPHVVGGVQLSGASLVAWTLGNFMFDQVIWPSFQSYLLTVDIRGRKVVRAYIEPLMLQNYQPTGLVGGLAGYVTRVAGGYSPGRFLMEDGSMEVDLRQAATPHTATQGVSGQPGTGTVFRVGDGWQVARLRGSGSIQLGRDLLWAGSFEDEDVDPEYEEGDLWDLGEPAKPGALPAKEVGKAYAYDGKLGVRLQRNATNSDPAILAPIHRIPVQSGTALSITGVVRASAGVSLDLQLSWYPSTLGPSASRTRRPIAVPSSKGWMPFRYDVIVPPNTVAVRPFVRLTPPAVGDATVDLDNIRLVSWAPIGSKFGPLYDHVRVVGSGEVVLRRDVLPGGEEWADLDQSDKLSPLVR